jgi:hypothetical protein
MGLLVLLFAKKVHFSIPPYRLITAATGLIAVDINCPSPDAESNL